jgi:hypothetical protein
MTLRYWEGHAHKLLPLVTPWFPPLKDNTRDLNHWALGLIKTSWLGELTHEHSFTLIVCFICFHLFQDLEAFKSLDKIISRVPLYTKAAKVEIGKNSTHSY